jgi:PAS domain S-box-containing protein
MQNLLTYLNPITRLGDKKYSIFFPLIFTLALAVFIDILVYRILQNPSSAGFFAIILPIAAIIYFSFRDGIKGGLISASVIILFYFYLINFHPSPTQSPEQRSTQWITVAGLGGLYLLIAIVIGWLKQTIDNLIQREADEKRRLQAILQQLPVGVLITDSKGKIIQGNKQVEMILGKAVHEGLVAGKDAIGNAVQKTGGSVMDKSVSPRQWPLAQTLATKRPVVGKEFTLIQENGKKVHLNISASVIKNSAGKVIAAASIISDVTPQKELEERKDDFVNMASHELKTPITSMKLYMEALLEGIKKYKDERTLKAAKNIKYQTEKLQVLVGDLLDVSRIQTGKLQFNKEEFKLDKLVLETVEGLQATAKQKIIFSKAPPVLIFADRFRIYQVLTNLITNASKYSSAETEIIVGIKKIGGKVIVSVQDFGIGITKEQQKKVFQKLYQVTDSKEKTFPGLGMGLYISKEIIKRHKGDIWVQSEKDKGSTFYFSLPLK